MLGVCSLACIWASSAAYGSSHTLPRTSPGTLCRTRHVSDTAPYAIGREIEDVVSVVEAFSEPVHLLGHSYGAILALEAAVSTNNLRTLTLFEPPIGWGELTPLLTRIDVLLDEGDREAALIMREIAGLPDDVPRPPGARAARRLRWPPTSDPDPW
jgi:pimeloyl-ACP methyl ester carboxylesterase